MEALYSGGADYMLLKSDAGRIPLADKSVHCCITSPPYWGLRDYGTARWEGGDAECDHLGAPFRTKANINQNCGTGADVKNAEGREPFKAICGKCGAVRIDKQIGLEETPEQYIAKMVAVFREVWRVLRDDGTCWINIGDSYATGGGAVGRAPGGGNQGKRFIRAGMINTQPNRMPIPGLKPKDLVGIPWMLAFALRADGWFLRSEIIWIKSNPMPESVTDRPTKAHEQIFLLTKSERYFYDMEATKERATSDHPAGNKTHKYQDTLGIVPGGGTMGIAGGLIKLAGVEWETRNLRTVWTVASEPYPGSHFATFPTKLVTPCIKAGTSEKGCCPACGAPWKRIVDRERVATRPGTGSKIKVPNGWDTSKGEGGHGSFHKDGRGNTEYKSLEVGNRDPQRHTTVTATKGWEPGCNCGSEHTSPCIVLDPFIGSGTTIAVANGLGRHGIGLDLNPEYLAMATQRITRPHKPIPRKNEELPMFPITEDSPCLF